MSPSKDDTQPIEPDEPGEPGAARRDGEEPTLPLEDETDERAGQAARHANEGAEGTELLDTAPQAGDYEGTEILPTRSEAGDSHATTEGESPTIPLVPGAAGTAGRMQRSGGADRTEETVPVQESEFLSSGAGGTGETTLRRAPAERVRTADGEERLVIAGRFEVLRSLGEGGMGKVYLVRDSQIEGREVALKLLRSRYSSNPQFRTLFFQEIRAAQKFVSEHVVQVRDCGQMDDGKLFLTMDFVPGEDLSQLLKRDKQLAVRHALEITRQILLGLQSGHEQGFIHRDVKPGNVILAAQVPKTDENPMGVGVRLLDFGIAGLVEEMGEGLHAGTPSYMSPEQVKGQRLDARSDLFAVGVVLFQMLTGNRPFTGSTKKEITTSVIETNLSPMINELNELPKPVRKILAKALAKNRDKRFQSALEFAEAIADSSAYKLVGEVSPLTKVALGMMTILAAVEGGLLWKQQEELKGNGVQLEILRTDVNKYQDDLTQKRDEIVQLKGDISTLVGRLESGEGITDVNVGALERELENKRKQLELVQQEKLTTAEELQRFKEQYEADKRQREEADRALQQENQRLRDEVAELRSRSSPAAQTAIDFDLIFRQLTEGQGQVAARQLDYARKENGSFAVGTGATFVTALVEAADRLEAFRASQEDEPLPRLVFDARRRFREAERYRDPFVDEARTSDWLVWEVVPGEPAPDRIAALEGAFQRISDDLAQAETEVAELAAQELAAIDAHPLDADPTKVIRAGETLGVELVANYLESAADYYEGTLVAGDRLDAEALRRSVHVDTWGQYLTRPDVVPTGEAADRMKLLWLARRWYVAGERPEELGQPDPELPELTPEKVIADWRAQFALQLAFERPDSGFPIERGRTQVYASESTRGKRTWVVDKHEGETDTSWDIRRVIYDEEGESNLSQTQFRVERYGSEYFTGEDLLLGLQELGSGLSVSAWDRHSKDLPDAFWTRGMPLDEYQDELARTPLPCLVVKRSYGEFWISPKLGIVFEKRDAFTRELVYAGRSQ